MQRMVSAMHHRGPDDHGIYADEQTTLGMTRLAILDLSPAGHQPMSTPDGRYWIVYNGEMYNFKTERARLEAKGVVFQSGTDTEVVLQLYAESGPECLHRMRGMFAFAIWDRQRERLFLARDRLGIKPLYFTRQGHSFLFASEVKALLASRQVERRLEPMALRWLLTFGSVPPPFTLIEGIKALRPGHWLIFEDGQERLEQYWDVNVKHATSQAQALSYPDLVQHLRALLTESVRLRLISDVPLGAFLSGGVDSGAVVGLMAEAGMGRIKTFSIGFDDEGQAIDESDEAALAARHFGTDHTKFVVSGQDVAKEIESLIWALDQPSIDGFNSYFVAKVARTQVTVALSGLGGDELFAGYPHFWRLAAAFNGNRSRWQRPAEQAVATMVGSWVGTQLRATSLGRYLDWAAMRGGFLARYAASRTIFTPAQQLGLLHPDLVRQTASAAAASDFLRPFDAGETVDTIQRTSRLELKSYMPFTLLRDMDVMSMAHSLEARVPLIDHHLVEFAYALPARYKYQPTGQPVQFGERQATYRQLGAKRILIDAVRDLLPPGFEDRPKSGFHLPYVAWLRGDLKPLVTMALDPAIVAARGLFRPEAIARLRQQWAAGQASYAQVFLLMVLELWQQAYLDSDGRGKF